MSNVFEFVAESRGRSGKNAARNIRRQGSVPAVIYGGHKEPQMLVLNHNEVIKHLNHEAVYSHVLDVKVDGKTEQAILKGVQRNPAKFQILHLDFLRVSMSEAVKVHVPLHFINENTSIGGKKGGIATHSMVDIEVSCLPSVLPEYIEVMWRCTDQVTEHWSIEQPYDMLVEMRKAALLIFMRTLFNVDFSADIDRLWNPILRLLTFISPGLWIFLPHKPRPGYDDAIQAIDDFLYGIIRHRRTGDGMSDDLLSLLVSVPDLDDGLIRDQCLTMLIAGHDTSTALLAWTLYVLASHPAALEQVRAEIDEVVGQRPPTGPELERLEFLERVIFETLRLYPPIHTGMRFSTGDVELLGCAVPKDSRLMYSIFLTQRMERFWPEANKFDPQRFCPENKKGRQPYTYLPFGGGPRNCIGAAFAQVEVKAVLARLIQTFDFRWDMQAVHPHMGATLEPRPGVPMFVKRRV